MVVVVLEDGRLLTKEIVASGDHTGADEVECEAGDGLEQQISITPEGKTRKDWTS